MGSIDLNEVERFYDLSRLKELAGQHAREILPPMFPHGRIEGDKLRVGNIRGDKSRRGAGGSCHINLSGPNAGSWHDFNSTEATSGGDVLDTIGRATGLSGRSLYDHIAAQVGAEPTLYPWEAFPDGMASNIIVGDDESEPQAVATREPRPADPFAIARWSESVPVAGTIAETHLARRHLLADVPHDAVRFSPYTEPQFPHGALIAAVTNDMGEVIAVQRIAFDHDGRNIRDPDGRNRKRSKGPRTDGAVRLRAPGAAGLVVTEGVEDALAVYQSCPDVGVWAVLGGLRDLPRLTLPECRIIIGADNDAPGSDAAKGTEECITQLLAQGHDVAVARAPEGIKDFNDLAQLRQLGAVRVAIEAAVPVAPAVTLERVVTFDDLMADVQAMEPKRLLTPVETKAFAAKVIESGVGYTDIRYIFQMVKERTRTTLSALDGAMNEVRGTGIVAPGGGHHHITPAVQAMCDRYIFVKETGQLFDRRTRKFYAVDAVRRAHRSEMPINEYGSPIDPEDFLFSAHVPAETVDGISYWPGQPETVYEGAEKCVNTWTRPTLKQVEGDVARFLDHVAYICDDDQVVAGHLLDYLAYIVAVPGGKVRWMPLIISSPGIGKKVLFDSIEQAIGQKNFRSIDNNRLASDFNGYLRSTSLVVIPELRIGDRVDVMNRLKPWVTDDTIEINDKGTSTFSMRNRANFLAFSNYKDATVLDDGDRRFFIHISKAEPKPKAYYDSYFDWLDHGGREAIYHWLCHRDLTKFEPNGRAPDTASKALVAAASIPAWESYLLEKYDSGSHPFASDLLSTSAVVDYLKKECSQSYNVKQVGNFLGKMGGIKLPDVRLPGGKTTLWAVRGLADRINREGKVEDAMLASMYIKPGESWTTGGALA